MSFLRSVDYLRESFVILYKSMLEYKANFVMGFIANVAYIFTIAVFYFLFSENFGDVVSWGFYEYAYFILFFNLVLNSAGIFFYGLDLSGSLKFGFLNSYLVRPLNVLWQYVVGSVIFFIWPNFFLYLILFGVLLFFSFGEIVVVRLFLLFPFLVLVGLSYFVVYLFLDSSAFFFRENRFLMRFYNTFSGIYASYPIGFFPVSLKRVSYLALGAFSGSFSVLFLFGSMSYELFFLLCLGLFLTDLVLFFLVRSVWVYGIRRYEAFG